MRGRNFHAVKFRLTGAAADDWIMINSIVCGTVVA
jgi:hypothetical protein